MNDDALVTVARWQLEVRRMRVQEFPASLFDESAWDMLLHLFVDRHEQRGSTQGELCRAVGGTEGVCSRWISHLVDEGQVERHEGERLVLTDAALSALHRYLTTAAPLLSMAGARVSAALDAR